MIQSANTSEIYELTFSELSENQAMLVQKSIEAQAKSYSPYSQFKVGCALLLDSGEIITAANQENAAYPACICAERVGLSALSTMFPPAKILAVAISASSFEKPISPCGLCRQSFNEYENRMNARFDYYLVGKDKILFFNGIQNILPFGFPA